MTVSRKSKGVIEDLVVAVFLLLLASCSDLWCADGPIFNYEYVCHSQDFGVYRVGGFSDKDLLSVSRLKSNFERGYYSCDGDSVSVIIRRAPACHTEHYDILKSNPMDTITLIK